MLAIPKNCLSIRIREREVPGRLPVVTVLSVKTTVKETVGRNC